jgi:hypothetical protein
LNARKTSPKSALAKAMPTQKTIRTNVGAKLFRALSLPT